MIKMNILILVNGAGLGNSVRINQIINECTNNNISYTLMASGVAQEYFNDKNISFIPLEQLTYKVSEDGYLDIFKTIFSSNSIENYKKIKINNNKILIELQNNTYNAVIIDSFYSISEIKNKKIPIYAINNSNILNEFYKEINKKLSIKEILHYYLIEKIDYLFHKNNVKKSYSINYFEFKKDKNEFQLMPLIVKDNIKNNVSENNIIFMLSGSNWKKEVQFKENKLYKLINKMYVLGIDKSKVKNNCNNIEIIGRTFDNVEYLNKSKIAVVNAGFSAVSEMIAAKKPMVIIPIENHSEQKFNAIMVENLGLGLIANEDNWEDKAFQILTDFDKYKNNFNKLNNQLFKDGEKKIIQEIINEKY